LETIHTEAYRSVVDQLVAARKDLGMNQEQLAAAWGSSQTKIARIEKYSRRIDIVEFVALCEILAIDPIDIVSRLKTGRSAQK